MKRWLAAAILVLAIAFAVYELLLKDTTVEAQVSVPRPSALIGSGSAAVPVGAEGELLPWFPLATDLKLPALPLSEPPKNGKLEGPVLEQARVLGAAPAALRPYLERSYYGESGVDVMLSSGIELRFGDDSQAARKWQAAATVLADPKIETLDYVDLHAPGHPAVGGSGHTLPPPP